MIDNFDAALAFTWRPNNDGQGYHVTPGDHGGGTNHGVTLPPYAQYRARLGLHSTTLADLARAGTAELEPVIRTLYWEPSGADALPSGTDLMVYDFGFGSGPVTAARMLQRLLGVAPDGVVGPATVQAAQEAGDALIDRLWATQAAFYRGLGQPKFLNGWLRRNNDRHVTCRTWISRSAAAASAVVGPARTGENVPRPDSVCAPATIAAALESAFTVASEVGAPA